MKVAEEYGKARVGEASGLLTNEVLTKPVYPMTSRMGKIRGKYQWPCYGQKI